MMLQARLPLGSTQTYAAAFSKQIAQQNPTYQWLSDSQAMLGGKKAFAVNYQTTYQVPVVQRTILLQHGLTMYVFHEAASVGTAGNCGPMVDDIASTVNLGF